MKQNTRWLTCAIAIASGLAMASPALADTTITTFDDFYLDGLFAHWATAPIDSGPTAYTVTATGYGSGYKDINPNINATGETNVELTVTIVAAAAEPGGPASGPIVSFVDADGTYINFAWFGQTVGTHVLTAALNSPTWVTSPGSIPGLDLATLDFFHIQDDPGAYQGEYTISWQNLRLTGAPAIQITSPSYNPDTHEFTLTWVSSPGKTYKVLHTSDLAVAFSPLVTDIPSGGTSTTTTVIMPMADAGFLEIQQQ